MDEITNDSQSRNAAKVAGGLASIALVATLTVKAVQFVGRKLKARHATETTPGHMEAVN